MSGKTIKKLRREYKKAAKELATKDAMDLQIFLANKSFIYRFKLAMRILFKIRSKK